MGRFIVKSQNKQNWIFKTPAGYSFTNQCLVPTRLKQIHSITKAQYLPIYLQRGCRNDKKERKKKTDQNQQISRTHQGFRKNPSRIQTDMTVPIINFDTRPMKPSISCRKKTIEEKRGIERLTYAIFRKLKRAKEERERRFERSRDGFGEGFLLKFQESKWPPFVGTGTKNKLSRDRDREREEPEKSCRALK